MEMLPFLPAGLGAYVVIVTHLTSSGRHKSVLDEVLRRVTHSTVKWAQDGELLLPATIYLAPKDHHTVVCPNHQLRVYVAGRVNRCRPAADPLFLSAATYYGKNAIAVILSGCLRDGVEGAAQMAKAGAKILVQDPHRSCFRKCPQPSWVGSRSIWCRIQPYSGVLSRRWPGQGK